MRINNINEMWNVKHPLIFTVIRFILGAIFTIRGIYFFADAKPLYYLIKDSRINDLHVSMPLAMIISVIHMVGGVFIILGLFTKMSVWAQIPIVFGGIVFINSHNSLSFTYPGLLLSMVILVLLVIFVFKDAGKISIDDYAKENLL